MIRRHNGSCTYWLPRTVLMFFQIKKKIESTYIVNHGIMVLIYLDEVSDSIIGLEIS